MKRIVWIIVCAVLLVGCAGCGEKQLEQGTDILPVDVQSNKTVNATLFFKYMSDGMLACENRTVTVKSDQKVEAAIIEELLKGPGADNSELTRTIHKDVKLIRAVENNDTLTLTFSKELLDLPYNTPKGWEKDPAMKAEVMLNRQLGIYSIVNSVVEYANYSRVQIEVEQGGKGNYVRVKRGEVGFQTEEQNPLGALTKNSDIVLTPDRVVSLFMERISNRDWSGGYRYLLDMENGSKKLSEDEFKNTAEYNNITIVDKTVSNSYNVSNDGSTAVVTMNYTIRTRTGDTQMTSVPVKLVKERSCWKIPYSFVTKRLFIS